MLEPGSNVVHDAQVIPRRAPAKVVVHITMTKHVEALLLERLERFLQLLQDELSTVATIHLIAEFRFIRH
jgi:hypothetical protein